jgi:predicted PurR-regulated permease PerM
MLGASTVINPIIKIVTTVVILGAVYLFFVKPALDTTENITDSINQGLSGSFESFDDAFDEAQDVGVTIPKPSNQKATNNLVDCVEDAAGNTNKIERCAAKFSP